MTQCSPSPVCHVSHVTCHVSRVTCHMSHVFFSSFFLFFYPPFPPNIGPMSRIGREIQCLPYAGFFLINYIQRCLTNQKKIWVLFDSVPFSNESNIRIKYNQVYIYLLFEVLRLMKLLGLRFTFLVARSGGKH